MKFFVFPLIFSALKDENLKSLCIQYECKIAMSFSTLKQLFIHLCGERRFVIPFEIEPTSDWLSGEPTNLLICGKKLPDRFDFDRNITHRYYKRQLRTMAQMGQTANPAEQEVKLTDRAEELFGAENEQNDFGRLTGDNRLEEELPTGQPTGYSIVQIGSERVLVRHPVDGYRKLDGNNVPMKIIPKLEYQIWFGGEVLNADEYLTEWLWSKFFRVAISRPRVQVQTGQVFVEEFLDVDNWMTIESNVTKKFGKNMMEEMTKKVALVLQKLAGQAARYEAAEKVHFC